MNTTAYQRGVRDFLFTIAPSDNLERAADEPQVPIIQPGDHEALDRFLYDRARVKLPNVRCCEGHRTPHEAFHHAYFAESPVIVVKASRGFGGKSFWLSTLAWTEALTLRADVNILGGSGEQSKRVNETIGGLWELPTAPREALLNETTTAQKQRLWWGNKIVALMASQASVRGPHPQRLRMDEVDEMKLGILDSAMGQPMSKGWVKFQVVLASTHQYANGTMTKILARALENGWPIFEWCYRENLEPHGWLSMAEVERKRAVLTKKMWDTEIELQEPSSEGRAIETPKVEEAFRREVPLEDPLPPNKENPFAGPSYAHGADWAKKVNHTVVVTIRRDVKPMRVVAVSRQNKKPWPDMIRDFDDQVKAYGGTATHDNTGLGQVIHDLLTVSAEPFDMIGRQRAELLSEYISAIEHGDLIWPRDDDNTALAAAYSEHKYASREDIYKGTKDGSGKHHLPDTISAAAFAWRAASQPIAAGVLANNQSEDTRHLRNVKGIRHRLSRYILRGNADPDAIAPAEQEPQRPVVDRIPWRRPRPPGE
jgi:hypothetical protein